MLIAGLVCFLMGALAGDFMAHTAEAEQKCAGLCNGTVNVEVSRPELTPLDWKTWTCRCKLP